MKRRSLIVLFVAVILCIGAVVAGLWNTRPGRAIRGIARVQVVNASPSVFDDVTVLAKDSGGKLHSGRAQRLEPGQAVKLDVKTSDLVLVSVAWRQGGTPQSVPKDGIACPGETLIVQVFDQNIVKTEYAR